MLILRPFIRYHLPALIYALLIFAISSLSSLSTPELDLSFQDKFYHLAEYALFGFLLYRSLRNWKGLSRYRYGLSLLLGVFWAATDELHQYFVPGRDSSPWDLLADLLGLVGVIWICRLKESRRRWSPGGSSTP
jgi:VanZ family protein